MRRYLLARDLQNDPKLIAAYEEYHKPGAVWTEIIQSLISHGIEHMEIYRVHDRLIMIIEVNDSFSFERKAKSDAANPKVQEWEDLMINYQKDLPNAKPGEKWVLLDRVFSFDEHKKELKL